MAWDGSAGLAGDRAEVIQGADSPFSAAANTASITVISRNDAPVLTPINPVFALLSDSASVTQTTVAALIGTCITDVDSTAAVPGIAVTGLQGNGIWAYSHDNGATWMDFGAASDASARLLLSTDLIRFTPNSITGGPASLSYVGWDRTSGVAEGLADVSLRGGTTAFSLARDVTSISGNDSLFGGEGNDTLIGLSGDDTLLGNDGSDTLDGGSGLDSIDGGTGSDLVYGGDGADFIETSDGNDTVDGGSGNDLIVGGNGAGNDRYTGGSGFDTVRYTSALTGITVDLAATTAFGNEIGSDRLFQIEGIIGGQAGDATLSAK